MQALNLCKHSEKLCDIDKEKYPLVTCGLLAYLIRYDIVIFMIFNLHYGNCMVVFEGSRH